MLLTSLHSKLVEVWPHFFDLLPSPKFLCDQNREKARTGTFAMRVSYSTKTNNFLKERLSKKDIGIMLLFSEPSIVLRSMTAYGTVCVSRGRNRQVFVQHMLTERLTKSDLLMIAEATMTLNSMANLWC